MIEMLMRTGKIDPKDYPFRHHVEAQKHLDTDELRHLIKPIVERIDRDYKGKEHLYCDPEQLNAQGQFRRPKILVEAEQAGYVSVMDHYTTKQNRQKLFDEIKQFKVKVDAEAVEKTNEDLKKQVSDLTALVQQLLAANANK